MHTYITSHGNPPFGCHIVYRQLIQRKRGSRKRIHFKSNTETKIPKTAACAFGQYILSSTGEMLHSPLYGFERDPNFGNKLRPPPPFTPRQSNSTPAYPHQISFLVSRDHFCFIETDICGVLCLQELNNSDVCVAKHARYCPIRKSDWGWLGHKREASTRRSIPLDHDFRVFFSGGKRKIAGTYIFISVT